VPPRSSPFDALFATALRSPGLHPRRLDRGECQSSSGQRCTLCAASTIDYEREVALKNATLQEFWRATGPSIPLDALVRSPLGRRYRTVTKRKIFHGRVSAHIGLIDPTEGGLRPFDALFCAIEPAEHATIYSALRQEIKKPWMEPLAEQLTYVVIKGTEGELAVIFNVREIGPGLIKAANDLSKLVSRACRKVVATFVYQEESGGRYYLSTRDTRARHTLRKLFGKSAISLSVAGKRFLYSPLSFSQVNHSILERMLETTIAMLAPLGAETLYDLYCGYGMFALSLAHHFQSVIGVERSPESIEAARANVQRLNIRNVRLIRQDITAASLMKLVQGIRPNDVILLDPPRSGTADGVIPCITAHRPRRALHIFCNIELIPKDIKQWENGGYRLLRAVPVDMFPGTPAVELMLVFERT
jgi:tRNA/tmRNA/rRNA uracil-C5-methylase (TrmA/RlmC/RlmD family)